MLVARMMYPVRTLGPGDRLGIWVCGCRRRCPNCANPELWAFDPSHEIPVPALLEVIGTVCAQTAITGLTISGGEPFEQAEELAQLLMRLPAQLQDVLIFSGYTLDQLHGRQSEAVEQVLSRTSVLVDGEYVDELNDGHPLRGSQNQCIHYLQPGARERYTAYIAGQPETVQNFVTDDATFSVGIHHRSFVQDIRQRMAAKGCQSARTEEAEETDT